MKEPNVGAPSEESQRQRRIELLLSLQGKLDLDLDGWYELRHGETDRGDRSDQSDARQERTSE